MSYYDRLHPWCIVRSLPNLKSLTVARFRRRGDAEAHLRTLRHLIPGARFGIVFDLEQAPLPEGYVRKATHQAN